MEILKKKLCVLCQAAGEPADCLARGAIWHYTENNSAKLSPFVMVSTSLQGLAGPDMCEVMCFFQLREATLPVGCKETRRFIGKQVYNGPCEIFDQKYSRPGKLAKRYKGHILSFSRRSIDLTVRFHIAAVAHRIAVFHKLLLLYNFRSITSRDRLLKHVQIATQVVKLRLQTAQKQRLHAANCRSTWHQRERCPALRSLHAASAVF